MPICGLLNLNKPTGITSRAAVDRVSRPLRGVKVGHAGTLDPLASGVLVVAIGSATRLIEYVQNMPKTYRTVVRLGATSDTLDADGTIVANEAAEPAEVSQVENALAAQVGLISQQPPIFSALKVNGARAYDLARAGKTVELQPRMVRVDAIRLIDYAWPRAEFEVDCGAGTYIRSIARDLGEALGCGGLVEVLTRTRIGPFTFEDALDPASLTVESISVNLRPSIEALAGMPTVIVDEAGMAEIGRGRSLPNPEGLSGEVAFVDPSGELLALAECNAATGRIQPKRVLSGAIS